MIEINGVAFTLKLPSLFLLAFSLFYFLPARRSKRGLCYGNVSVRVANRPGMAGIVPELTNGVPCPGRGSFCPGKCEN